MRPVRPTGGTHDSRGTLVSGHHLCVNKYAKKLQR